MFCLALSLTLAQDKTMLDDILKLTYIVRIVIFCIGKYTCLVYGDDAVFEFFCLRLFN